MQEDFRESSPCGSEVGLSQSGRVLIGPGVRSGSCRGLGESPWAMHGKQSGPMEGTSPAHQYLWKFTSHVGGGDESLVLGAPMFFIRAHDSISNVPFKVGFISEPRIPVVHAGGEAKPLKVNPDVLWAAVHPAPSSRGPQVGATCAVPHISSRGCRGPDIPPLYFPVYAQHA